MPALPNRQRLASVLLVALPAAVWLCLCHRLRPDWQLNPQYSHGWFVPILVFLLWHQRWQDRPAQGLKESGYHGWPLILVFLTAALLPTQLLLISNPDWRVPYWAWATLALGISLTCLAHHGGLPWIVHFAPALALMLFAVPWPTTLEQQVNTWLLGGVVVATNDMLNLLGLAVSRSGNTLVFAQGQLGVEDACSGIRSLHGSLMIAYILGELGRWRWPWRLSLLGLAVILAFVLNAVRATFLGWNAVVHGSERADQWHDPVGATITILTLCTLVVAYLLLERKLSSPIRLTTKARTPLHRPPVGWGVTASFLLLGGTVMASSMWFDEPDHSETGKQLVIDWETLGHPFEHEEVPYRARTQLRYSKGKRTSWVPAAGTKATAYDFRWDRDRISLFNAIHRPDVCLPSIGLEWVESIKPITVTTRNGTPIKFHGHQFLSKNRPIFVWFGVWDHTLTLIDLESAPRNRLRQTWERKRVESRHSIELILSGQRSWSEAKASLDQWVSTTIKSRPMPSQN